MTKTKTSAVWNYYTSYEREAICHLCGRSVPTTDKNTTSLRSHLKNKHPIGYDELISTEAGNKTANKSPAKVTTVTSKNSRKRKYTRSDAVVKKLTGERISSGEYYEVLAAEVMRDFDCDEDSPPNRIRKDLSKSPIDTGHFEAINIKEKDTLKPKRSLKRRISSENADDDVPDQAQETEAEDVWSYFEKIPSNRARCILCKETFNRHLPFLAKHMTEKHRKVALDLPSDSDEDQNCYTEVVYLEEEQPRSVETIKPKPAKKTTVAKRPRLSPRYEFVNKLNEVEIPSKNNEVDDEIENFGRYVIGLLKKMPKDVSTQLQMDIISMIMTAKLKLETSTTESVNVSMSNVEDGVIVTPSNVIVTTPSNVIHTTQNKESLPTLVIGVENES